MSAALEEVLLARRPVLQCGLLILFLVVVGYGYLPIHELIHAGACLLVGGAVEELAIDSRYGGAWVAKVFPFVVADSEYAGQLTRFSVPNGVAFAFVFLMNQARLAGLAAAHHDVGAVEGESEN